MTEPTEEIRSYQAVTLHHIWPTDKYETLVAMASFQGVELVELVDYILDSWATMAGKQIQATNSVDLPGFHYEADVRSPKA